MNCAGINISKSGIIIIKIAIGVQMIDDLKNLSLIEFVDLTLK